MYTELAQEREDKEKRDHPEKFKEPAPLTEMFLSTGEIRQCNEGKYDYILNEWDDPEFTLFEVKIPKHLDTSLLEVNMNPRWVSVRIKGTFPISIWTWLIREIAADAP